MGDDPFQGIPFLGDLAKLLGSQSSAGWDGARQLALSIATDGQPESNVDPLDRIALEQLARVAELQVGGASGLPVARSGLLTVVAVTPGVWASRSLDAYKPLFEKLSGALGQPDAAGTEGQDQSDAMLAGIMRLLTPMMLGMSAGSMVGHLARRSFGQYDLPIPRPTGDELLLVPSAINRFADDWSLPLDDVRLWICLNEVATHTLLGVPHVRSELDRLLNAWVAGFRPDSRALEQRFDEIDLDDSGGLSGLSQMFSDPQVLLGAMQSAEQLALRPQLDALVAVIVGYVDHLLDSLGTTLLSSYAPLSEAMRRQRIESDQAGQFVHQLLGLSIGRDQVERGSAFVSGVVERAGTDGLAQLWVSPRHLPTPAEVDAPGLWLARIEIPET
jgi:putative hydrolase